MESWLKRSSNSFENTEGQVAKAKPEPEKFRLYLEDYVLIGFTSTSCNPPKALCFFCGEKLANSSMKPAHLQHHLKTKHGCHVDNPPDLFKRKLSEFRSSQDTMRKDSTTSAKALEASYAVSLLVAKAKKPFTIAEDLLLPAAVVLAETMLDKNAAEKLKTVPLSNDSVCRRVDTMGTDIVEQVVGKLSDSFSLQLDESTDVSGNAQLVAFLRYVDTDDIYEHILFCKSLKGKTTGEDIFDVVNAAFCENDLRWKSCSSICTDAAASMTGSAKGLIAHIKKENPDVMWTHCVIHREALASKKMSPVLHDILNSSIKVINVIKSRPLNARLFRRLCENMGAEHTQLLLHTEDTDWLAKLCYLADIFSKLNKLNMSLQGKDTSILNLYDKVGGFLKKAELWRRACAQEDFTCFPQLDDFLSSEDVDRAPVKLVIVGHLTKLIQDFHSYFPDMEEKSAQLDWVRNPFLLSKANRSKLPVTYQEKLLEVSSDRGLQMKFAMFTLTQFWVCVKQEHPDLGQKALEQLLPFASTYLCEASFAAMTVIKTKQRNRMSH
ncbi:zinc finger MYM-type protein 6-like [Leucoraja erinacea]|uniref:zinc finger MYM-type protein 6-like n=1 Tax=Leucoraja erinaceus TaxID=7782 RepID=UPI002455B042|nr:zinc finger MYM-type protein 6-like [Leucoraja erinacea]